MTIPVYVLGCDETPDRKAAAEKHFRARGVSFAWWRSFHGKSWGLDTTREYEPGRRISPGHVGLCLGAWSLWQHVYHQYHYRHQSFLLFEDDAVLPENWDSAFAAVEDELDDRFPDWQFVFLGLAETEPHVWHKVTERVGGGDSRLCRMHDPFGTHAIMLRRSALPVLLDNMVVAERNLDQQLWQLVLSKGLLRWCAVLPSLVTQRTFDYTLSGKPEWAPCTIDPDAPRESERLFRHEITEAVNPPSAARTPPELVAATTALIDPFPCIYRGEFLEENGTDGRGRTVPLSQCARLNSPCHSRRGETVGWPSPSYGGGRIVACETCEYRLEMASDGPRDRLPLPEGHFNPSVIWWNGKLVLATRDSWGHSAVALWYLHNDKPDWTGRWSASAVGSFRSDHPLAPRLEDPRLFVAPDPDTGRDALHAMFNLPDGYPPKRVQVGYARFAPDLSGIKYTHVYPSPHGNLYEKNWVPFHDGQELRWVYETKPDHLVLGETQSYRTDNRFPWTGGVIRGGATPVLVELGAVGNPDKRPVYFHFFHGCLKRVQGSVYTVGCCVFDARPPFNVLRQTPTPLVWPDLPAAGEDVVKRYVVWPGGAVPHAGAWHLAVGVDDTFCRIIRLPFDAVESALSDVSESDPGVSLRDTPLAKGTNR